MIFPIGAIEIYVNAEFKNASLDSVVKLVGLDERPVKVAGEEMEFEEVTRDY